MCVLPYRRITEPAHLPTPGEDYERPAIDFKSKYAVYRMKGNPAKWNTFEIAKDVAMFANALGGTILVGAKEDRTKHVLDSYEPMTDVEAGALTQAFDTAVQDRCSPRPRFDCDRVPKDGGVLLAVNVEPFPGQPVGVYAKADKEDGWGGSDAWAFPYRTGTQCIFTRPEHLPMLIDPRARRTAILLEKIPVEHRGQVRVYALNARGPINPNSAMYYPRPVTLQAIDLFANTVVLGLHHSGDGTGMPKEIRVPLDDVDSVWQASSDLWAVRLRGAIALGDSASGPMSLDYYPVPWR
jgi:hypothetical protein